MGTLIALNKTHFYSAFTITVLLLGLLLSSLHARAEDSAKLLVKTDLGDITIELYPEKAPATVKNFLGYVDRYYYDGLIFHRVVKDFVIQTGGFTFDLYEKEPGEAVINESGNGLKNLRGTLAMARFSDPDSARAQFFINLRNNPHLNAKAGKPGYTVFGQVLEGIEVADAIGNAKIHRIEHLTHLPVEPVRILSIRRLNQ